MEKRKANLCPACGRALRMRHIGYINICVDKKNMAATGFCSYLDFTLDTINRTVGGVAPGVALYPQKRSPRPLPIGRRGKLPILTACIRRSPLLRILLLTCKYMNITWRKINLPLIDAAPAP
jgi:hypothetical protein